MRYRVEPADLHAHLYRVTLTINRPAAVQDVSLPVWIPGSYLVREFARHLQGLQARQGGRAVQFNQVDKCTWRIEAREDRPLELAYEVYAFDNSVRTAWLDDRRGFFNGTSLCLRVHGQEDQPHDLTVAAGAAPRNWQVATALEPQQVNRRHWGLYRAASYDELVDNPVELGDFWSGEFRAGGVPHRFVVAGAPPSFDGQRLLADARRICDAAIRFWHPPARTGARGGKPPFTRYLFLLNVIDDGYGGLEHRQSTALICGRRDLPRLDVKPGEGYTTLQGLISHEYFHAWNVKRLRPSELTRYDYTRENYTALLWFFEGFTSYYDDLLLCRAGLVDAPAYLRLLNKTVNQLHQTPGRRVQSVAQASFDAWVKYYRADENTPNATVSYYGKGALVALCLDLTLRRESRCSLDDVMRGLWKRCAAGPMTEADLLAELQALTGRSWARELKAWVHGTGELPLQDLLGAHGVGVMEEPAALAQRLGLRVTDSAGLQVKHVLRDGAAEQAGMAAGDEWIGIEVGRGASASAWKLSRLDDLPLYAGSAERLTALVARDRRLLRLPLRLPRGETTWRLIVAQAGAVRTWLQGA